MAGDGPPVLMAESCPNRLGVRPFACCGILINELATEDERVIRNACGDAKEEDGKAFGGSG